MADIKITALTELTGVAAGDIVEIVDDPLGVPLSRKVTLANLVPQGINGLLFRLLTAGATGANSSLVQPWFPTTGAVSLAALTTYFFDGLFHSSRSAGTTSHSTLLAFGGTATLTRIRYLATPKELDSNAIADLDAVFGTVATEITIKAASTSSTENVILAVRGHVAVNAAGTFIPQFRYSSAPGGAPTIQPGTFFRLWPVGSNTIDTVGTWT